MSVVRLAACQVSESDGRMRGLSVGAGHVQAAGTVDISQIRLGADVAGAAFQPAEGAMGERKGESADPDGGVILVAVVVFAALAFVLGASVGFSAAAVLR